MEFDEENDMHFGEEDCLEDAQAKANSTKELIEFFNMHSQICIEKLEEQMYTIASLYDYAAEQVGAAYKEALEAKRLKEYRYAILDKSIRSDRAKVTVSELDSLIKVDPRYQEAVSNYNEAEGNRIMLNSKLQALQMKKDMLQILGSARKRERDKI